MPFISKQQVQQKSEALKTLNKKYGVKARFSGSGTSELTLKITAGKIDFIHNYCETAVATGFLHPSIAQEVKYKCYIDVNEYHLEKQFSGEALEYLKEAHRLMLQGHHDNSNAMTDYFDFSWYNSIKIGGWKKPYQLLAE